MSHSESQNRKTMKTRSQSRVGTKLERNLWAYAAAAGAAGVGMLALAPSAEAKVVYTAANEQIPRNSLVPLDLNGDGVTDFNLVHGQGVSRGNSNVYSYLAVCHIKAQGLGTFFCESSQSMIAPNAANQVRVVPQGAADPAAGVNIGPGQQWGGKGLPVEMALRVFGRVSSQTFQEWKGPWANGGKGVFNRYLGFKFKIGADFHYGWARITVKTSTAEDQAFFATLTGYAYETVPGKAIVAGATTGTKEVGARVSGDSAIEVGAASSPASLGMLSLGAAGLSLWRREDSQDGM